MKSKPDTFPSNTEIPLIKAKNQSNRRRLVVSGVLIALITFVATGAMLLLLMLMFAPQFSNALLNTDVTQHALYGTAAAVRNEQTIVDMTSTALVLQVNEQHELISTLTQREDQLNAREADLNATGEAIATSIVATQTADRMAVELQQTQVANNFSATQNAIEQQVIQLAIEATATQLALSDSQATATEDIRPFMILDSVQYIRHPTANCSWQGIAGQILNLEGNRTGINVLQVRVLGENFDETVSIGDNLGLGDPYTWAIRVGTELNFKSYFLRLETLSSEPLSPMIRVTFTNSCESNLAVVNLAQIKPLVEG